MDEEDIFLIGMAQLFVHLRVVALWIGAYFSAVWCAEYGPSVVGLLLFLTTGVLALSALTLGWNLLEKALKR